MFTGQRRFSCLHGRCAECRRCACAACCDFLNVWIGVCRGGCARARGPPTEVMTGASCCSQATREGETSPVAGYPTFNLISGLYWRGQGWKKHSHSRAASPACAPFPPSFVSLVSPASSTAKNNTQPSPLLDFTRRVSGSSEGTLSDRRMMDYFLIGYRGSRPFAITVCRRVTGAKWTWYFVESSRVGFCKWMSEISWTVFCSTSLCGSVVSVNIVDYWNNSNA